MSLNTRGAFFPGRVFFRQTMDKGLAHSSADAPRPPSEVDLNGGKQDGFSRI